MSDQPMVNFSAAQQKFWLIACQPELGMDELLEANLAIAWAEYPRLDLNLYRDRLHQFSQELTSGLKGVTYPMKQVQVINQYLYNHKKFQGNQANYYDPRNSLITDVLDSRQGIPISLSVIYLILSDRAGVSFDGVNFPGHFLIKPRSPQLEILVDPFFRGEILFEQDCVQRLEQIYGKEVQLQPEFLTPVGVREILQRILTNLKMIYLQQRSFTKALRMVQWILLLYPESINQIRDRGLLCYQLGYLVEAKADLQQYVEACPQELDTVVIKQILAQIS
ncbi:MAG: tetratricopeptide repeat protein [Pseudanabaenaceae cyanobacterium bins.68]|nr:tetratricopeptide repeat protein [Pseudanabaenaceae cyanobacterium bins.68]